MKVGIKEIQHQKKIIDAVKHHGGAGAKWSSAFEAGKPDLLLGIPGLGICMMEVKVFHDVKPKYFRNLEVTQKQSQTLKDFAETGGICMIGLVTDNGSRSRHLHIMHWKNTRFGEHMEDKEAVTGLMPHGGHANIPLLITEYTQRIFT